MRAVFNKDRYVGGKTKEEENNINHPNHTAIKENRKMQTPNSYQIKGNPVNSSLLDELNGIA